VYFIEDDKFDISNKISTFVKHTPQDLCRHLFCQLYISQTSEDWKAHDQTAPFWIDLDISRQNTNGRRIE